MYHMGINLFMAFCICGELSEKAIFKFPVMLRKYKAIFYLGFGKAMNNYRSRRRKSCVLSLHANSLNKVFWAFENVIK